MIKKLRIETRSLHTVKFSAVTAAIASILRLDDSLALLNSTNMHGPVAERVQAWAREGGRYTLPHEKILPIPVLEPIVLQRSQNAPARPARMQDAPEVDLEDLVKTFGGMKLTAVSLSAVLKDSPVYPHLSSSQFVTLITRAAAPAPIQSSIQSGSYGGYRAAPAAPQAGTNRYATAVQTGSSYPSAAAAASALYT